MRIARFLRIVLLVLLSIVLVLGVVLRKYVILYLSRKLTVRPPVGDLLRDPVASSNPKLLLQEADRLAWLFNWHRAEPLYIRAEELFKESGDTKNEAYARVGRVEAQGQHMPLGEVSATLAKQLEDPVVRDDPKLRLRCLAAKGYVDIELNMDSAERDWGEAQTIAKRIGDFEMEGRVQEELSTVAFMRGEIHSAAHLAGTAILSAMASGDVAAEIHDFARVGRGYNFVKESGTALPFLDRAIRLASETPDAPFPAFAYAEKAHALMSQGKSDEARRLLTEALAGAEKDEDVGDQITILDLLGELDLQSGVRGNAIAHLESAGTLGQKYGWATRLEETMFVLTKAYSDSGDLKSAERCASIQLDAGRQAGDGLLLPRDLTTLADLEGLQGHSSNAEKLYEQAQDAFAKISADPRATYWFSSLAGAMSETYLHHFELWAQQGDVDRALMTLERVRGRTTAAFLENTVSFEVTETPKRKALEAKVSELQRQLLYSSNQTTKEGLQDRLEEYERRLEWVTSEQRVSRRAVSQEPVGLNSLQSILRDDELVLEYVLDEPRAYCVWISKQGAGIQLLPAARGRTEELTRSYLKVMLNKDDGQALAQSLSGILISPVPETATKTRLIIVPDGSLNLLPFDVLPDSAGEMLVKSRTISYAPSSTVLYLLRSARRADHEQRSLLAVGDVAYQNQAGISAQVPKPKALGGRILRGVSDTFGTPLDDLPETREEVDDIGRLAGKDSVLLLGSEATETAFKSEPLADFRVIHLAVHGIMDSQSPDRSGLVLGVDPASHDDGFLQVREIMSLQFDAELVTLSACNTGVGEVQGEEGVSGLTEAFLLRGARTVVASLWSADDTYTLAVMTRFYNQLAEGKDKALALRAAKLGLLTEYGSRTPPYYWAAFVLVGDGSSSISSNGGWESNRTRDK
jgi:CHAT domain-containing protein